MNQLKIQHLAERTAITPTIVADIQALKIISEAINDKPLTHSLGELAAKLESNRFYLVIVGLFKRGKSSLINALIGRELAPVAVTPLTSVITFFEFGKETSAEVLFDDGRRIDVEPGKVAQYISEEENPENKKQVQYLKIFTNSSILENIVLVDTPGLGSMFSHNSDTTLKFLPKIDAALFVLSADIPISKTDEEFLLQMKTSIPDVLFVLNKSDLLHPDELNKMIGYNLNSLKKIFHASRSDVELIPVSARNFFSNTTGNGSSDRGNINLLRGKIEERIIGSKDEILSAQSVRRLLALANQLDTLLVVRAKTLQLPMNELEEKRASMQHSLDFLDSGKDDFEAVVKNRIKQLTEKVGEITEQKRKELEERCKATFIEKAGETWEQIKKSDADVYYINFLNSVTGEYDFLRTSLEEMVKAEFSGILLQYSRQSQSFLNEIVRQMEQILGIHIGGIISSFDLDVYTAFYIYEGTMKYTIPSLQKKIIYRIIPGSMVRSRILRQMYQNCMEVVKPNAGRIRADIDYRISESFRKFRSHFNQKLEELLQSLKNMIDESIRTKKSFSENIGEMLATIQLQKHEIDKIKEHYSPEKEETAAPSIKAERRISHGL